MKLSIPKAQGQDCAVCVAISVAALALWTFTSLVLHIVCQAVLSADPTVRNDMFGISACMVCTMITGKEPNDMYAKHATCLLCTNTNCLACHSLNVNTSVRQSFTVCNVVLVLRCWSTHQFLHREHEERGGNGSH